MKTRLLLVAVLLLTLLAAPALSAKDACPYKVYVILGFHANFYHSWRGDTPDEAGFGTDIRIVREIIRMLDEANQKGLDARGYWESENLFTLETILPKYAPDIIAGIRRRVEAGQDEALVAPYSNSTLSAMTEDEARAAIRWAVTNPWGSGVKDLYGSYVPLVRPQEAMTTTGMNRILAEEGMTGIILAYSAYPFTAFTNFIPVLPPAERYNPVWMRMADDEQRFLLFPCVSAGDVVNYISLEKWMLALRKLQTTGKVKRDLVIHINFDADAETWLPVNVPPGLRWFPNVGGLPEYIDYVNKYDWAEFTNPGEYLKTHGPEAEVMIRQDMADGAFDGYYSWSEKYPSLQIWSEIERARLYARQAESLAQGMPDEVQKKLAGLLRDGRESSFFQRVAALSTTHFGMSTPMVNEERQAVAEGIAGKALAQAAAALRLVAERLRAEAKPTDGALYSFLVSDSRPAGDRPAPQPSLIRVPVLLSDPAPGWELVDDGGRHVPASLINLEPLGDGSQAAELLVPLELSAGEERKLHLLQRDAPAGQPGRPADPLTLANDRLKLKLAERGGIASFALDGLEVGGADFLAPFITYTSGNGSRAKPANYGVGAWKIEDLSAERWDGIARRRLTSKIEFKTPDGPAAVDLAVTLTLPADAPFAVAEVEASYPYTQKRDMIHNIQQKLRRYLDLRWVEVAPFQLHPSLDGTRARPLKVWKHNYLGVTSWYELDYGQINPKNAELDSFNHQVTAGWVAVTDKERGLLVAEDSEALSSFAFMPMRLREREGQQQLYLNPFGSYHGEQLDYTHLGGNGLGRDINLLAGPSLRPNGPSYNGQRLRFTLLLAPYAGDRPPAATVAAADNFFYGPAVVYLRTPEGVTATVKDDVRAAVSAKKWARARLVSGPLPAPLAFVVNPTAAAVDVVWDEPADARIDGYDIEWRSLPDGRWQSRQIDRARRCRFEGLENGQKFEFRMRARGVGGESAWTPALSCEVGPVKTVSMLSAAKNAKPLTIGKMLYYGVVHALTTP